MNKESEQLTHALMMSSMESVDWSEQTGNESGCSVRLVRCHSWGLACVARVRVEGKELEHSLDTGGSKDASL